VLGLSGWPLWAIVGVFGLAASLTVIGAIRLSALGDRLADRTGWGEALFGAVLFGAITSLSGIIMTATAAADGRPGLAYSNAVGGIAAQTAALAVADLFLRRVNLEHAAASLSNIFFGTLLVGLLVSAVLVGFTPARTVLAVHPGSVGLIALYLFGLKLAKEVGASPYWTPEKTPETRVDEPQPESARERKQKTSSLLLQFLGIGAVVAVAGWAVATSAGEIGDRTQLSETLVGGVLMGVVNGLPEAITAAAAVKRGALTLAVAAVLGGNAFDVLNLVVGDLFFRGGSLYHAATPDQVFLTLASTLMTVVILLGLLRRQKRGFANIGFESLLVLVLYSGAVLLSATSRGDGQMG
jgi:cation:H+ antiporter